MTDVELFQEMGLEFQCLAGQIDALDSEMFRKQFESVFSCEIARGLKGVVYTWSTVTNVPRMKGESNVIYIGMTTTNLKERHFRYAQLESSAGQLETYRFIISQYGPLTVRCAKVDDPRKVEKTLIDRYIQSHLEMPPLNASR